MELKADKVSAAPPSLPPSGRSSATELLANVAIALIALAGAVALQWGQLQGAKSRVENPRQAEKEEQIRLRALKRSPTLGFDNLIADWAFLNYLQYFGDDDARNKTGYTLSADFFDLITQRDPRFVEIYPFLSTGVSFYMADPKRAVQYMDRGTKTLSPEIDPRSYIVWRYKGLDQLLLIGDVPGAIHSHDMAAKWVKGTSDEQFAPLFQQTADFLKKDPDSTLVRFQSWLAVYYQAIDKKVQERAKQEILKLGAQERRNKDGQIYFILPENFKKPSKPLSQKKPS